MERRAQLGPDARGDRRGDRVRRGGIEARPARQIPFDEHAVFAIETEGLGAAVASLDPSPGALDGLRALPLPDSAVIAKYANAVELSETEVKRLGDAIERGDAFGDGGDRRWAKALKVSTNLFSAGCGQWIRYRSR